MVASNDKEAVVLVLKREHLQILGFLIAEIEDVTKEAKEGGEELDDDDRTMIRLLEELRSHCHRDMAQKAR